MLAPHGTSREMSGNVGTKKSDPPDVSQMDNRAKSDERDQCRVKFDVVDSTDMRTELMANSKSEPEAWRDSKAPWKARSYNKRRRQTCRYIRAASASGSENALTKCQWAQSGSQKSVQGTYFGTADYGNRGDG